MKKAKRLYALLGVLVLVCAATLVISRQEEEKEKIKNSDEVVLTIDSEAVTALSWEYGETALAFHKEEGWLYDEDQAFPVDQEQVMELLEQFQEFGVAFEIDEVEDYAQYGLDDPTCTIRITEGEQEYEILLGAYSTMDSQRYVSIGDGKVYLVSHDPMEDYEIELKDMIKHDEMPDLADATAIRFAGIQEYDIVYEEESANTYCAEDVYFTEEKPLDSDLVGDYLSAVDGVGLKEYVSYNVTQEELAAFGLDAPELSITVEYPVTNEEEETVTETVVLHLGRNQEELAAAQESEEEDALSGVTAYARVGESQIVYEITSQEYQDLTASGYDDLRHKQILTASFDDIYQIDITLEGTEHTLSSVTEEDVKTWKYREKEELSISELKTAVQALEAVSFTDEEPADKEEISLTVYLENENYPEISVALYRYDGSECIAVLDGRTVARVSRSVVVDLIEAVNAIVLSK